MQYFILSTPGYADEIARWYLSSTPAYYDARSDRWVPEPLLAVMLVDGGGWRRVEAADLPAELVKNDPASLPARQVVNRSSRRRPSRSGLLGLRRAK
ncbi:hypothetical protein [Aeromicrobium sp.]|uniref:hypothetical protein n=1 Tax=Aeromicrobium sp. TaxID=1871063 RepID=UPI0030C4FF0F